ncbi:hypothetical protein LXL04_008419 [Taraxacum kok-saghyz]
MDIHRVPRTRWGFLNPNPSGILRDGCGYGFGVERRVWIWELFPPSLPAPYLSESFPFFLHLWYTAAEIPLPGDHPHHHIQRQLIEYRFQIHRRRMRKQLTDQEPTFLYAYVV